MAIVEEVAALREQTLAAVAQAADTAALDQVRVAVLGKSGTLTGYLRSMGQVPKEERAQVGKTVNEVRVEVETALAERKAALEAAELAAAIDAAAVDVTLPGRAQQIGTRHLINGIIDEISEIFLGLGYSVAQGPEVETVLLQLRGAERPGRPPEPRPGRHVLRGGPLRCRVQRAWRVRRAAAHADLRRAGARDGGPGTAHLRDRARKGVSPRRGRPQPPAAVPRR